MRLGNVSRETEERLTTYLDLLRKWSPKINLVSPATLGEAWDRHFVDSAQLMSLVKGDFNHWLDLGSGGGFPGLVIAMLLDEHNPAAKVTLMESDQRKCVFLRTVARETGIQVDVVNARIETAEPQNADVISARALTSLSGLLSLADRHGHGHTISLFPKGRSWAQELEDARQQWRFTHAAYPSKTNPEAVILKIEEIEHV